MMSGGDPGQEVAGLERDTLLWLSGTTGVERGRGGTEWTLLWCELFTLRGAWQQDNGQTPSE